MNIVQVFIPEIILLAAIVITTLLDAFKILKIRHITLLTVFFSIFALFVQRNNVIISDQTLFLNYPQFDLLFDQKIYFAKSVILLFSIVLFSIIYGYRYVDSQKLKTEYILVILISTLSALVAAMSKDLLSVIITLEVQMLGSYILTSMQHKNIEARAAAIKYFILGTIVTCFMLFGISLIYGFAGSIEYEKIKIAGINYKSSGLALGIILVLLGLMFKLGLAPLHFWIADVYHGTNVLTIIFFTLISKFSSFIILYNFLEFARDVDTKLITQIILIFAISSIIVGAVGGLKQFNLKRLLAYSAIFNIGFAILPIVIFDAAAGDIAMKYIIIYAVTTSVLLLLILAMNHKNVEIMTLQSIEGMGFKHKYSAIGITITLISLIGIPPFAGFFAKYSVISYIIQSGYYKLAIFMIIGTVVSSFYYLQIIKSLYFVNEFNENAKFYIAPIHKLISLVIITYISFYSINYLL